MRVDGEAATVTVKGYAYNVLDESLGGGWRGVPGTAGGRPRSLSLSASSRLSISFGLL